jgi:hypothetical protein
VDSLTLALSGDDIADFELPQFFAGQVTADPVVDDESGRFTERMRGSLIAIPEPGLLFLVGMGGVCFFIGRRRRDS